MSTQPRLTGDYDNGNPDVPANYQPQWFRVLDAAVVGFTVLFLPLCFLAMLGYLGQALYTLFSY